MVTFASSEFTPVILLLSISLFSFGDIASNGHTTSESGRNFSRSLTYSIVRGLPSRQRSFYVRIRIFSNTQSKFCGGTILDNRWILTSAYCLHFLFPSDLVIESGDFSKPNREIRRYFAKQWFKFDPSNVDPHPEFDIALIETTRPMKRISKPPPLCTRRPEHVCILGACGLGAEEAVPESKFPFTLRETYLYETVIDNSKATPEFCADHKVCTVPITFGSGLCWNDEGGPMYQLKCESREVECLYGVASYIHTIHSQRLHRMPCSERNVFASIPFYYQWITATIGKHL